MVILNKKKIAHEKMIKRGELIHRLQENWKKNCKNTTNTTTEDFRACLLKSIKASL